MLSLIKNLKNVNPEKTFQNVLLFALSRSIRNYLTKKNLKVPEMLTTIVPRFVSDKNSHKTETLRNNTNGILINLPIRELHDFSFSENHIPFNAIITKLYSKMVPPRAFSFFHKAMPMSLVFSNLPGPNHAISFGNFSVKNLVFYTLINGDPFFAVGSTSFNGKIALGILADSSIVPSTCDLNEILIEIVNEIKLMNVNS